MFLHPCEQFVALRRVASRAAMGAYRCAPNAPVTAYPFSNLASLSVSVVKPPVDARHRPTRCPRHEVLAPEQVECAGQRGERNLSAPSELANAIGRAEVEQCPHGASRTLAAQRPERLIRRPRIFRSSDRAQVDRRPRRTQRHVAGRVQVAQAGLCELVRGGRTQVRRRSDERRGLTIGSGPKSTVVHRHQPTFGNANPQLSSTRQHRASVRVARRSRACRPGAR